MPRLATTATGYREYLDMNTTTFRFFLLIIVSGVNLVAVGSAIWTEWRINAWPAEEERDSSMGSHLFVDAEDVVAAW